MVSEHVTTQNASTSKPSGQNMNSTDLDSRTASSGLASVAAIIASRGITTRRPPESPMARPSGCDRNSLAPRPAPCATRPAAIGKLTRLEISGTATTLAAWR